MCLSSTNCSAKNHCFSAGMESFVFPMQTQCVLWGCNLISGARASQRLCEVSPHCLPPAACPRINKWRDTEWVFDRIWYGSILLSIFWPFQFLLKLLNIRYASMMTNICFYPHPQRKIGRPIIPHENKRKSLLRSVSSKRVLFWVCFILLIKCCIKYDFEAFASHC